ncbi:RHS repeat-associated core domain-containing protein [Lysobacter enzymogenes]|uniref:RHS repeat-associated core domain-containing protein n=1 Tax=Lysobacter enzymogenes TaxID=69 RepID=A0A3N2RI16_LYSEN|nr:RHS repeat-associated core domain-containing protein [Lysobacter enzymogenes]
MTNRCLALGNWLSCSSCCCSFGAGRACRRSRVVERTDWEPHGAAIGKPAYDGVEYTGHVMDGRSGLTYMQQRYYDSSLGDFLSTDPISAIDSLANGFNRYRYRNGNPYFYLDSDGREGAAVTAYSTGQCSYCLGRGPDPNPRGTFALTVGIGAMLAVGVLAPEVAMIALAQPVKANSVALIAMEVVAGDSAATAGFAVSAGVGRKVVKDVLEDGVRAERQLFGPFHRLGDSVESIGSTSRSGELQGNPPTNFFQSNFPKVQAYDGPVPVGGKGFEFYTPNRPDVGHVPGKPTWTPAPHGDAAERSVQAVIQCVVTNVQC